MSNDAQNDRAGHGNGDGAAAGQVLVYDDNGKYDTGQPPGSEPAHEELFIGPQVHSGQRQKYRQHPDKGETEDGVKHDLPGDLAK